MTNSYGEKRGGYAKNCHLETDMAFISSPYVNKIHKSKHRTSNTGARALDDDDAHVVWERFREETDGRAASVWMAV